MSSVAFGGSDNCCFFFFQTNSYSITTMTLLMVNCKRTLETKQTHKPHTTPLIPE